MRYYSLVPELSISNWEKSRYFYCELLHLSELYENRESGLHVLSNAWEDSQVGIVRLVEKISVEPVQQNVKLTICLGRTYQYLPATLDKEKYPYHYDDDRRLCVYDPDGYYWGICD